MSGEWFWLVQGFYQFVQIEVGGFWFFEAFGEGVVLEVPDAVEECDLREGMLTPLWLFLEEREFSTMTRFLPGEISEAFQNSVPRSMPITCEHAEQINRSKTTFSRLPIQFI